MTAGWIRMLVPEAAMNENNLFSTRENEIGLTGQVRPVKPIPVAEAMNQPPNCQLRFHALAFNPAHVLGAALWAYPVHCELVTLAVILFGDEGLKRDLINKVCKVH